MSPGETLQLQYELLQCFTAERVSRWGGDGSGRGGDGGDVFFSATIIMLYSQTCLAG